MGGWGWGGVCGEGVVAARGKRGLTSRRRSRFDAQIERDTATPIRRVIHQTRPGGASSATLWRLLSEDCKLLSLLPLAQSVSRHVGTGVCGCGSAAAAAAEHARHPRPLLRCVRRAPSLTGAVPPARMLRPRLRRGCATADVRIGMERVWTVWCVATGKASSTRLVFQIEPKEGPASGGTQVHTPTQSTLNARPFFHTSHAPHPSPAASTPGPGPEQQRPESSVRSRSSVRLADGYCPPHRRDELASSQVTITVNTQVPDGPKNIHCAFGEKVSTRPHRLLVSPP